MLLLQQLQQTRLLWPLLRLRLLLLRVECKLQQQVLLLLPDGQLVLRVEPGLCLIVPRQQCCELVGLLQQLCFQGVSLWVRLHETPHQLLNELLVGLALLQATGSQQGLLLLLREQRRKELLLLLTLLQLLLLLEGLPCWLGLQLQQLL
jgi:hypothetical protein